MKSGRINYDRMGTSIEGYLNEGIFTGSITVYKDGVKILDTWGEHSVAQILEDYQINLEEYL